MVTRWPLILRALSFFVIVSLLTAPMAPFSAAVAAAAVPAQSLEQMAMPSDMPCCPDQHPSQPGGQKYCPVALVCLAKCTPGDPVGAIALPAFEAGIVTPLGSDRDRPPFISAPPDRPPRA